MKIPTLEQKLDGLNFDGSARKIVRALLYLAYAEGLRMAAYRASADAERFSAELSSELELEEASS